MNKKNLPAIAILCALLVCCSLFLGCSSKDAKKEEHFKKGMTYFEHKDMKSATIEFRNAIQIDPKFAKARYRLGLTYLIEMTT